MIFKYAALKKYFPETIFKQNKYFLSIETIYFKKTLNGRLCRKLFY